MSSRLFAFLAVLAVAVGASATAPALAAAGGTDPLQSTGCREALAGLHRQEVAAAASASAAAARTGVDARRAPNAALVTSRRHAAVACLETRADAYSAPTPQRLARPPPFVAVPVVAPYVTAPIAASPPARTRLVAPSTALVAPLSPPPTLTPAKPGFIVSCDSVGCWANDGSRLNRVGPDLWGSRGACAVQGRSLQCP